jgi:hypothetical protein
MTLFAEVLRLLRKEGAEDIVVFGGGRRGHRGVRRRAPRTSWCSAAGSSPRTASPSCWTSVWRASSHRAHRAGRSPAGCTPAWAARWRPDGSRAAPPRDRRTGGGAERRGAGRPLAGECRRPRGCQCVGGQLPVRSAETGPERRT